MPSRITQTYVMLPFTQNTKMDNLRLGVGVLLFFYNLNFLFSLNWILHQAPTQRHKTECVGLFDCLLNVSLSTGNSSALELLNYATGNHVSSLWLGLIPWDPQGKFVQTVHQNKFKVHLHASQLAISLKLKCCPYKILHRNAYPYKSLFFCAL